jgi:hypothetical protein
VRLAAQSIDRLVLELLVVLLVIPVRVYAEPVGITPENISAFSQWRYSGTMSDPAVVGCGVVNGINQLGQITKNGVPSVLTIGAQFSALPRSIDEQQKTLRKRINSATRALKRPKSSRALKTAKASLKKLQRSARELLEQMEWCRNFSPLSGRFPSSGNANPPGRANPPGQANPPSDDTNLPPRDPTLNGGSIEALFPDEMGPSHHCRGDSIAGTVAGGDKSLVTLGNDEWLRSVDGSAGSFTFTEVPDGTYSLYVEGPGVTYGPEHILTVDSQGSTCVVSFEAKTVGFADASVYHRRDHLLLRSAVDVSSRVASLEGANTLGAVQSTGSNAAQTLLSTYGIALDSSDLVWSGEFAERLLTTVRSLWSPEWGKLPVSKPSTWKLSGLEVPNDLQISESDTGIQVTVAASAFRYASDVPAIIDGQRGKFFSQRLSKATLRFITQNGRDTYALDTILERRFNALIPWGPVYNWTSNTTGESDERFQLLSGDEKLTLLTTLAEVPEGIRLKNNYLVLLRRKNTVHHPFLEDRKALFVGWSSPPESPDYIPNYMEVMQAGLNLDAKSRLETMIAAITGMLWDREIPTALKQEWIKLGGWSNTSTGGWQTDNPTEAWSKVEVGVYTGPKADFAASVATYVSNGEELRARSPKRYEFLRLYVMHGSRYIRKLREDLSFPVLNLWPDYTGPGGIREATAVVRGNPSQDKIIQGRLLLRGTEPRADGAWNAHLRFVKRGESDVNGAGKFDMYCYAHNPDSVYKVSLELRCSGIASKYLPAGFYDVYAAALEDQVGNVRRENRTTFAWSIYVGNYLLPPPQPEVIAGSQSVSVERTVVNGQELPVLKTQFRVTNVASLSSAWAHMQPECPGGCSRSMYDEQGIAKVSGNLVTTSNMLSPFAPSGRYGLREVTLFSKAMIGSSFKFSSEPGESEYQMPFGTVYTEDEDSVAPEIDINQIGVTAQTTNPEAPNGETRVNITLRARDDKSGLRYLGTCLRSPRGRAVCQSIQDSSFSGVLENGYTTEWRGYATTVTLPAGSEPGVWGIESVYGSDKVGWFVHHNLSELVEFKVESQLGK